MAIDLTQRPEITYDDSGSGTLTVSWLDAERKKMFSLVLTDGAVVGVNCSTEPASARPWKIALPKSAIRINCAAFETH